MHEKAFFEWNLTQFSIENIVANDEPMYYFSSPLSSSAHCCGFVNFNFTTESQEFDKKSSPFTSKKKKSGISKIVNHFDVK